MNTVMARALPDGTQFEFAYQDEEIADPTVKMTVLTGLKNASCITADEVRAEYGREPMSDEQKESIAPPPPVVPPSKPGEQMKLPLDGSADGNPVAGEAGAKVAKASASAGRLLRQADKSPAADGASCRKRHPGCYP